MDTTRFERIEKKYMLTQRQYDALRNFLTGKLEVDQFGNHTICNIYFDTADYVLVRKSIEKPQYKEKLRLRCYGNPTSESEAFVELKKKVGGVVYKRRVEMKLNEAMSYVARESEAPQPCQITKEIDWFLRCNDVYPQVLLAYERVAMYGIEDPNLRITFDTNIRFRNEDVDLTHGAYGTPLLQPNQVLMEIKIPGVMPLWLSHELSRLGIFPSTFSKYGRCYSDYIAGELRLGGVHVA